MINKLAKVKIFLQEIEMSGIRGINQNGVTLDLRPKKTREFLNNVEFFGLDRSRYEFGALRSAVFIGENASGKSSVLEGIFRFNQMMRNPQNFLHNMLYAKYGKLTYYGEVPLASWKATYVKKTDGGPVYKYFVKMKINEQNIVEESMHFIKTIDGKTISKIEEIYSVKNSELISVFGKKIDTRVSLYGSNGFLYLQHNGSFLVNMVPDIHKRMAEHTDFMARSFSAEITRREGVKNSFNAPDAWGKSYNIKLSDIQKKLYKIFDKNIMEINVENGITVIKYKLGDVITNMPFDKYILVASPGNMRAFDLVQSISQIFANASGLHMIDEIEVALHSTLSEFIVGIIQEHNKGQVFLATHDISLTELDFRTDQIFILNKDEKNNIHVINGYEITPSKNSKFVNQYMKSDTFSKPSLKMREEIMDAIEDYE